MDVSVESLTGRQKAAILIIAVGIEAASQIFKNMKDKDVDYPVIHDPASQIARQYAIRGVPSSFVIDADGNIHFVEVGYTTGIGLRLRLWWSSL